MFVIEHGMRRIGFRDDRFVVGIEPHDMLDVEAFLAEPHDAAERPEPIAIPRGTHLFACRLDHDVRQLDRQGQIEQRVHERQVGVLQVVVVDGTAYMPLASTSRYFTSIGV